MALYDIVIHSGRVIDGTGNPWFYGDIAVKDGRIVQVGKIDPSSGNRAIRHLLRAAMDRHRDPPVRQNRYPRAPTRAVGRTMTCLRRRRRRTGACRMSVLWFHYRTHPCLRARPGGRTVVCGPVRTGETLGLVCRFRHLWMIPIVTSSTVNASALPIVPQSICQRLRVRIRP